MPYKDPVKRRQYFKEYKRKQRAHQGLTNSPVKPVRKAYLLPGGLRLPGIPLKQGQSIFITNDFKLQQQIEQDRAYGEAIFSWEVQPAP